MASEESDAVLREQLRVVEEDLANVRRTATEVRRQIGDRSGLPADAADTAAAITAAEEQEALVKVLEDRRDELRRRIGAQ